MIIRIWKAKVVPNSIGKMDKLLGEFAVKVLKKQKGCLHVFTGKNLTIDPPEVVSITIWADIKSVRAFYGEKWKEPHNTSEEKPHIINAKLEQSTLLGYHCSGQ